MFDGTPSDSSPIRDAADLLQHGYRYALSLCGNLPNAQDLVQDACLRLYGRYGTITSLPTLFLTIRRLYIDSLRRDARREFENIDELDLASNESSPNETARHDLETMLLQLRPAEREVIFLHHVHGHTAEEISQITRRSRNTVLSLLRRGMAKLQGSPLVP